MEASAPHWTTYLALAVALAGLLVSVVSYRKANSVKTLDLRLDLRNTLSALHMKLSELPALIQDADNSRKANASAAGRTNSGLMKAWANEIGDAKALVEDIAVSAPEPGTEFRGIPQRSLEDLIVEIQANLIRLETIERKYVATIEQDRQNMQQRREIANKTFNSK